MVELTGATALQEDLPKLLADADVFALPCVRDSDGDMDGLPQVLIEAMLLGVPAISTRLVGIPDLVRHEENGLLVEPGDVSALADVLERLLGDLETAEALGERAAAWARAHFGRAEAIRRMSELFVWAAADAGSDSALPETLRFPPSWESVSETPDPEVPIAARLFAAPSSAESWRRA